MNVTIAVGGERLGILRNGKETYPAMLRAIAGARRSVCLQTYILRSDRTGWRFADALAERSRLGVEVSVMYDAWGSGMSSRFLDALHSAGVRTLAFHPIRFSGAIGRSWARLRKRNHRKTLVVDGAIAFIGGLNIADDYASPSDGGGGWRDTHARIEGPAAAQVQALFVDTWLRSGGRPFGATPAAPVAAPAGALRIVGERLPGSRRRVREAYLDAFERAGHRIAITSAYFLPTRPIRGALARAAARGVSVMVILPGTTDLPLLRLASQHLYRVLLRQGIRLFEWMGPVLHAKTAVVDGRWATIGSSNLDTLSMRVNLEANVIVDDEPFAQQVESMFSEDLLGCREVLPGPWSRRPRAMRLASWLAYRFRRWL